MMEEKKDNYQYAKHGYFADHRPEDWWDIYSDGEDKPSVQVQSILDDVAKRIKQIDSEKTKKSKAKPDKA